MKSICLTICCCLIMTMNPMAQSPSSNEELSNRKQHIVRIAAYTGKGDLEHLKTALVDGLDGGLTVNEIREVLVHAYAYCGFPRSLRGLQTFISVLDERKERGIEDVAGRDATPVKDKRSRYERGRDILTAISGMPADAPKAAYAEFAPVIEQFLKEHLFADLFERDVLTYYERELATVSVLAAMGGVEPMARSHMGICLNLGIKPGELRHLLDIVERNIGYKEADAVRKELNALLQAKGLPVYPLSEQDTAESVKDVFPKGGKLADNPNFTGEAWLAGFVSLADSMDCTVSNVTFAPGVRNNWHSHPGGQILLCTSGKGYYQEKGKPARVLLSGDVVKIAPDVVHWHGAAPDSEFTHIAIGTQQHKGGAVWYEPVTDEEYNNL